MTTEVAFASPECLLTQAVHFHETRLTKNLTDW